VLVHILCLLFDFVATEATELFDTLYTYVHKRQRFRAQIRHFVERIPIAIVRRGSGIGLYQYGAGLIIDFSTSSAQTDNSTRTV